MKVEYVTQITEKVEVGLGTLPSWEAINLCLFIFTYVYHETVQLCENGSPVKSKGRLAVSVADTDTGY